MIEQTEDFEIQTSKFTITKNILKNLANINVTNVGSASFATIEESFSIFQFFH